MEEVRSKIMLVLPLEEDVMTPLMKKLQDVGVENPDDLKFVQPEDITTLLKPIQVRKLLQSWKGKLYNIFETIKYFFNDFCLIINMK